MINLPLNIDYTGKVVVVTGAGGVLCSSFAKTLARAGAKVALLDINEESAKAYADEIVAEGGKVAALDLNEEAVKKLADELKAEGFICEGFKANVLEVEALEEVHEQVKATLGECDILERIQCVTNADGEKIEIYD